MVNVDVQIIHDWFNNCFPLFLCMLIRASDISREKKKNFAGFSGANSRENWPISRDFRGKKSKFAEKSADFAGYSREKVKIRRKIGRFPGF